MTLRGNISLIFNIYFALFWYLGKKKCLEKKRLSFQGKHSRQCSLQEKYNWAKIAVFLQFLEGWWNWHPTEGCRSAVWQNLSPIYYKHWGLDTGGGSKTNQKVRAAISHTGMDLTHLMQRVSTLLGMRRRGNHNLPGGKSTAARGPAWSCPVEGNGQVWKPRAPQVLHWEGQKRASRDHDWDMLWILTMWNEWQGWKQDSETSGVQLWSPQTFLSLQPLWKPVPTSDGMRSEKTSSVWTRWKEGLFEGPWEWRAYFIMSCFIRSLV